MTIRARHSLIVLCTLILAVLAGAYGSWHWAWDKAISPTCADLPEVRADFSDVAVLARRMTAYRQDASENALLALTANELVYLLGDRPGMRMSARFVEDDVVARLAIPDGDVCYNVGFRGSVTIDDGVATLTPDRLIIGELDVTGVVGGWTFEVEPEDVPDTDVGLMLANTRRMRVRNGRLTLALHDRLEAH